MKEIKQESRHPIVYFIILASGVLYSFFALSERVLLIGFVLSIGFLILEKRYKLAIILVFIYSLATIIQYGGIALQSDNLESKVNRIAYFLMKIGYTTKISVPTFCGLLGLIGIPEGRITEFFKLLKLPKAFSIGFCLFLRFIPTIHFEYRMIRSAQKFRNIGATPLQTLITFPKVFVRVYIPLLMRTMVIGEEISVSMYTRGITLANTFTPYSPLDFSKKDILLVVYIGFSILIIGGVSCFV